MVASKQEATGLYSTSFLVLTSPVRRRSLGRHHRPSWHGRARVRRRGRSRGRPGRVHAAGRQGARSVPAAVQRRLDTRPADPPGKRVHGPVRERPSSAARRHRTGGAGPVALTPGTRRWPGTRCLATDATAGALADGRLTSSGLGVSLAEAWATPLVTPRRFALSLAHAIHRRRSDSRELLHEHCHSDGVGRDDAVARSSLASYTSDKAGRLTKSLLADLIMPGLNPP